MRSLPCGALVGGLLTCCGGTAHEASEAFGPGGSASDTSAVAPGDSGASEVGTTSTLDPTSETAQTVAGVSSGGPTSSGGADTSPPGVQPWAVGTDVRISVWPDADTAWFEALEARLQSASDLLWSTTEGQHYVARVWVQDRQTQVFGSGGIHFHVENLGKDHVDSQPNVYGYWDAALSIHLGGAFQTFTFVHEWGHVAYGLPDEYGPQCGQCMMASTAWTYCDDATHNPASHPVPCWALILQRFPAWNHPNSNHAPQPPPIEVVEIIDN